MAARRGIMLLLPLLLVAGCQAGRTVTPTTPAPPPCDLAGFGEAPGLDLATLPKPRRKADARPGAFEIRKPVSETGRWVDAGAGWRAWRYWVRSETARSVAVKLDPFALPPAAQFWLCSPDRTTRQGPLTGRGFADVGRYASPDVPGPELWLEILAPAGAEPDVQVVISEAFAPQR